MMDTVEYRHTEKTATVALSIGAVISASQITRLRDGGLSAVIKVESPEGLLGGGAGNSRLLHS